MTKAKRVEKLKHFITCLKCEVSGKCCDINCPTQYDAGNMGEIIENLEEIAKALEQEPFINKPCVSSGVCEHDKQKVLDKIRAEIEQLDTKRIEIHRTYHTIEREVIQKDRVLEIIDKYKAESE